MRETETDYRTLADGTRIYSERAIEYGEWVEVARVPEQATAQVFTAGTVTMQTGTTGATSREWPFTMCVHYDGFEHASDGTLPCPLTAEELAELRANA